MSKKTGRMAISFSQSQYDVIKAAAAARGMPMSALVERACALLPHSPPADMVDRTTEYLAQIGETP